MYLWYSASLLVLIILIFLELTYYNCHNCFSFKNFLPIVSQYNFVNNVHLLYIIDCFVCEVTYAMEIYWTVTASNWLLSLPPQLLPSPAIITTISNIILLSHHVMVIPNHLPASPLPTTKCIRCTTYGLQCSVEYATMACGCKFLCHQCEAAGLDQCLFLPSVHLLSPMPKCNIACIHYRALHWRCIFQNEIDLKCTRCTKGTIPCVFKLNGEWV